MMKNPVLLWADVPNDSRWHPKVDRMSPGDLDWFKRRLTALDNPNACHAAVKFYQYVSDTTPPRYYRCAIPTVPGEKFCFQHGGPKIGPPSPSKKKIEAMKKSLESHGIVFAKR